MAGAEAAYREALAAEPNALMPLTGLASVLRKTGRAAEAEPLLRKAVDAGVVEAHKELARVLVALGRAGEALSEANLAAAMSSENDVEAQQAGGRGEGRAVVAGRRLRARSTSRSRT